MLEVLIAIFMVGIGMMAFAAMQLNVTRGMRNDDLFYRAMTLSAELADRVRENRKAFWSTFPSVTEASIADPGFDCVTVYPASGACTQSERAQADLWSWWLRLQSDLPGAKFSLQCTDDADPGFADGNNDGFNDADTDGDPCTQGSRMRLSVVWREALEKADAKASGFFFFTGNRSLVLEFKP